MTKANDLTVLVLSCDKYQDLWDPFFSQFSKYWKDCPYDVVLGSNTKRYARVKTLLSGPDHDWSSSLQSMLVQIKTPYVFLWLDDIFPIADVPTERIRECIAFMKRAHAKQIHLEPTPKPDQVIENGAFGVYERGAPYRVTALGLWDVEALKNLLLTGESPWNFEIMGSYRSAYVDGFYCVMEPFIKKLHVVEKGRIFQDAYRYCKQHGISLDASRGVIGEGSFLKSELQKIWFNIVIQLPWRFRVRASNILKKLLISY